MKKLAWILVSLLLVGCSANTPVPISIATNVPTQTLVPTETPIPPTETPAPINLPDYSLSKIPTVDHPDAVLNDQCLNVSNIVPTSKSIIILRNLNDVVPRQSIELIFIDMYEEHPKGISQTVQFTANFSVSLDKKLIAYEATSFNNGEMVEDNLIIANGDFQPQNSSPWDDKWGSILGWTSDQKIIILSSFTDSEPTLPASYILVDPLNNTQQPINLGISDLPSTSLYDLPYWGGWYGVSINPIYNLAVYPRQSNVNEETYMYALWDISSNKPLFSLENIFSAYPQFIERFSMPSWSTDGTQFALVGVHQDADVFPIKSELFLVKQDGEITQLTNLSSAAHVWASSHSWAPDNSHIAFFASPPQAGELKNANTVIVNTKTLDVTDLCLSVGYSGSAPIWSPNGKQFLIIDKYEQDHQRILLVDLEKYIVYPIAEDADVIGWMDAP